MKRPTISRLQVRTTIAVVAAAATLYPVVFVTNAYISYQNLIAYPQNRQSVLKPAKLWLGAYLDGGYWSRFWFDDKTKTHLNSMLSFRALGRFPTFDLHNFEKYRNNGVVPLVSLEPWNPGNGTADPDYSLSRINSGVYDRQFGAWADGMRRFGKPIMLRFAHEMNGPWYPWGVTVNGNTPSAFVQAWRHVHGIFVRHHATNVLWVWSPNVSNRKGHIPLANFYPGNDYTDFVGLVGYYKHPEDTFTSIFGSSLAELGTFTKKPLLITETAVSRVMSNPKAKIEDLFTGISKNPQIVGVYWLQKDKRFPWAMTSPEEFFAFGEGVQLVLSTWESSSRK